MKIRYKTGPDELKLGDVNLTKNKWQIVPKKLADEIKKQPRKGVYDFEISTTKTKENK